MPTENGGTPSGGSSKKKKRGWLLSKLSLSTPEEKKQKRDGPLPEGEEARQQATTAGERRSKFLPSPSWSRKGKEKKHTGSEEGQQQQQTAAGTGTKTKLLPDSKPSEKEESKASTESVTSPSISVKTKIRIFNFRVGNGFDMIYEPPEEPAPIESQYVQCLDGTSSNFISVFEICCVSHTSYTLYYCLVSTFVRILCEVLLYW